MAIAVDTRSQTEPSQTRELRGGVSSELYGYIKGHENEMEEALLRANQDLEARANKGDNIGGIDIKRSFWWVINNCYLSDLPIEVALKVARLSYLIPISLIIVTNNDLIENEDPSIMETDDSEDEYNDEVIVGETFVDEVAINFLNDNLGEVRQRVGDIAKKFGFIGSGDGDDIIGATIIKAIDSLNHRLIGDGIKLDRFFSWISKIATRVCIDELRQRRRRLVSPIIDEEEDWKSMRPMFGHNKGHEDTVQVNERLVRTLLQLHDRDIALLVLRYWIGVEFHDIVELGICNSEAATKTAYHRARESFKNRFRESDSKFKPINYLES